MEEMEQVSGVNELASTQLTSTVTTWSSYLQATEHVLEHKTHGVSLIFRNFENFKVDLGMLF